jgi:hypothetical protein
VMLSRLSPLFPFAMTSFAYGVGPRTRAPHAPYAPHAPHALHGNCVGCLGLGLKGSGFHDRGSGPGFRL